MSIGETGPCGRTRSKVSKRPSYEQDCTIPVSLCNSSPSSEEEEQMDERLVWEWYGTPIKRRGSIKYYNGICCFTGKTRSYFKVGDDIEVASSTRLPYVARIEALFTDSSSIGDEETKMATLRWYFRLRDCRGKEAAKKAQEITSSHELFASSCHDDNPVQSFIRICYVVPRVFYEAEICEIYDDMYYCREYYCAMKGVFLPHQVDFSMTRLLCEVEKRRKEAYMCCKIGPQHQCIIPDMQGSSSVDRGDVWMFDSSLAPKVSRDVDQLVDRWASRMKTVSSGLLREVVLIVFMRSRGDAAAAQEQLEELFKEDICYGPKYMESIVSQLGGRRSRRSQDAMDDDSDREDETEESSWSGRYMSFSKEEDTAKKFKKGRGKGVMQSVEESLGALSHAKRSFSTDPEVVDGDCVYDKHQPCSRGEREGRRRSEKATDLLDVLPSSSSSSSSTSGVEVVRSRRGVGLRKQVESVPRKKKALTKRSRSQSEDSNVEDENDENKDEDEIEGESGENEDEDHDESGEEDNENRGGMHPEAQSQGRREGWPPVGRSILCWCSSLRRLLGRVDCICRFSAMLYKCTSE